MEENIVQQRLVEAASAQGDDPGWSIYVMTAGIRITYTWRQKGRDYMLERVTPWLDIERAGRNFLLDDMFYITQQKMGLDRHDYS